MQREGAVGVSSREAPPKSSRSFALNRKSVGGNGVPSVIGARYDCIGRVRDFPEYRWYHGLLFALFCNGRTERLFLYLFCQILEKEKQYAERITEGV